MGEMEVERVGREGRKKGNLYFSNRSTPLVVISLEFSYYASSFVSLTETQ